MITLLSYHISLRGGNGSGHICEATVKFKIGNRQFFNVADGDGPVHALDSAIRGALVEEREILRRLQTLSLTGYSANADAPFGTNAETDVSIKFSLGGESLVVQKRSKDSVEAGIQALVEGMQRALASGSELI